MPTSTAHAQPNTPTEFSTVTPPCDVLVLEPYVRQYVAYVSTRTHTCYRSIDTLQAQVHVAHALVVIAISDFYGINYGHQTQHLSYINISRQHYLLHKCVRTINAISTLKNVQNFEWPVNLWYRNC